MGLINGLQRALEGNQARAIAACRPLLSVGTPVDRIGIFQFIAECLERIPRPAEAAAWRLRAARAWWRLPAAVMPKSESAYYALVEYKAAAQDAWHETRTLRAIAREYTRTLEACIARGSSGYSHKIVLAAVLCERLRDFRRAMHYFFLAGDAFAEQAAQSRRADVRCLARECYEAARNAATMSGLLDERHRAGRVTGAGARGS